MAVKDWNCGKLIGSNLVMFYYKEFEKFGHWKSVRQLQATFIVYSAPVKSGHVKVMFFVIAAHSKCKHREQSRKPPKLIDIS